jgi:hypothetical protein
MTMRVFIIISALAIVFEVDLVGKITGAELMLFPVAIIAAFKLPRPTGSFATFYKLSFLWLCAAFASDLLNHSAPSDYLRGWAKIIFMISNFTALRLLIGKSKSRLLLFILVLFISGAIRAVTGHGDDSGETALEDATTWKMGLGQSVSAIAMMAPAVTAAWPALRPVGMIVPFAAAGAALAMNARNLTGITALAGVFSAFSAGRRRPLGIGEILAVCATVAVAGFLVLQVYAYAASEGLLGWAAKDKYLAQSRGNQTILLAGRPETYASVPAIIDAPLLGHGSWARDMKYVELEQAALAAAGEDTEKIPEFDLIPTHSHLFGAWVEHGVMGGLFWMWVVYITGKALLGALRNPEPSSGFVAFVAISFLWDIFFSPFGLDRRTTVPAWIYLMLLVGENSGAKIASTRRRRPKALAARQSRGPATAVNVRER